MILKTQHLKSTLFRFIVLLCLFFVSQVSAAMEMMERLKEDLEGKEKELSERKKSVFPGFLHCGHS